MSALPYYKSLDGMRAIAVLMVMCIHSRLMPIGWVGVQMFFVLSGFLITGILITQTNRPFGLFLRRFYWRRGLRIWPLYFLFLGLCAIAYAIWGIPESWRSAWIWLVTFTHNLARMSPHFVDSDYFGHFWTLCIEEQFYLVWPFLVFFIPLKHFRRFVLAVIIAGPVLRYLTAIICASYFDSPGEVQRAVHSLPTSHLDAFASGALLAVAPVEWVRKLAPWAARIFFGVLLVTILAGLAQSVVLWRHHLPPHWLALGYDDLVYFRQSVWAYTLLNLTSAALIFCAINDTRIARVIAFRPLVYVGAISFGVYVWHLPLMRIFTTHWAANEHSMAGLARFAVYFLTTLGVASLSYYGFERYFLRMKKLTFGAIWKRGLKAPADASPGE